MTSQWPVSCRKQHTPSTAGLVCTDTCCSSVRCHRRSGNISARVAVDRARGLATDERVPGFVTTAQITQSGESITRVSLLYCKCILALESMDSYDAIQNSLAKLRLHAEQSSPDPHQSPRGSPSKPPDSDSVDSDVQSEQMQLSDQLDQSDRAPASVSVDTQGALPVVWKEGYGFRPLSGSSTPQIAKGAQSPLPDPNGLGWPAKSTLSRLYSTPAERTIREQKLSDAVRTLLECIGEDPDREGLKRTPERYAQALLWMTRGYEERLAGAKLT